MREKKRRNYRSGEEERDKKKQLTGEIRIKSEMTT